MMIEIFLGHFREGWGSPFAFKSRVNTVSLFSQPGTNVTCHVCVSIRHTLLDRLRISEGCA